MVKPGTVRLVSEAAKMPVINLNVSSLTQVRPRLIVSVQQVPKVLQKGAAVKPR